MERPGLEKLGKILTLTAKYAAYAGDANAQNVARNAPAALARDIDKFWLQADVQF